jgi:hypothetical protein
VLARGGERDDIKLSVLLVDVVKQASPGFLMLGTGLHDGEYISSESTMRTVLWQPTFG